MDNATNVALAIREAYARYTIEGSGEIPYRAPWYLIDTDKAELDVNWPGELIGEYKYPGHAWDHKWRLVAEAAIAAHDPERVEAQRTASTGDEP